MANRLKLAILLTVVLLLSTAYLYRLNEKNIYQNTSSVAALARVLPAHAKIPATQLSSASPRQFSIATIVYVPVDGVLKKRGVSRAVTDEQIRAFGNRTPLVNEVIRLAPGYFPPNARVTSVTQSSGRPFCFLINLNRAFANPQFWRGRNRYSSVLGFQALARNVAFMNEPKGSALPVQFVIDGKQVANIGAFAASQPLKPAKIIGGS